MEKQNEQPWEEMKKEVSTVEKLRNNALLLEFMAGESFVLYGKIQEYLDTMLLEALQNGYPRAYGNDDVTEILKLHSKCLKNVKDTKHPENVFNHIRCDEDFEKFAECSDSIPWVHLEGKREKEPFCFTESTVSFLSQILNKNTRPCSVYIGGNCKISIGLLLKILNILKDHSKVNFTYITLGAFPRYINKYEDVEWEKIFDALVEFRKLLGIGLYGCDIPATVLETLGGVINIHAKTLFVLNLAGNSRIKGNFDKVSEHVTTPELSLSWLNLTSTLSPEDSDAAFMLLAKAKGMRHLFLPGCVCEVSRAVVEMRRLRYLWIADTVNSENMEGLDVKIFRNLHQFKELEELYAAACRIDNADLENVQIKKLSKRLVLKLDGNNKITDAAAKKFEQDCKKHGVKVMWD